ncbi:hypothetical protein HELRODRAFT_76371, partial [Helobdella robusta]|uniref:C2H2-type domain-containing protein n=1 Tax=Helobdella robusta TaxID=6412 RepID=T1G2J2_HELRO
MHGIFLCAHCEFSSEIADVLEDHRKVSHPGLCGRKLCKKCRVLYQGDELEEHERLCSGEKQNWICPICQKEFKFLSVMKAHARGGEKKFRCDWPNCGKAFCHTDNLKVHYRRHTDEKPYKCDKCASSYRQKSGLKYHLEKAHD